MWLIAKKFTKLLTQSYTFFKYTGSMALAGAVIAIPLPLFNPKTGALIGAGIGIFMWLTKKGNVPSPSAAQSKPQMDVYAELLKLNELRQKGAISDAEFEVQKKKILDNHG